MPHPDEPSDQPHSERNPPNPTLDFPLDTFRGIRCPPMPPIWESSFSTSFDPRQSPPSPPLFSALSFMFMERGDPARQQSLRDLPFALMNQRLVLDVVHLILRHKVDAFKARCRAAGLESPARLSAESAVPYLPQEQRAAASALIARRSTLDSLLLELRAGFPDKVKAAMVMDGGGSRNLVAALEEACGSLWLAFENAIFYWAVALLRIELYSSLGTVFRDGLHDLVANPGFDPESLADEFATQSGPLSVLLEDIVMFTRFLNGWLQVNPNLEHFCPSSSVIALICRVTVLHISFFLKFRRSAGNTEGIRTVLRDIDADIGISFKVLDKFAMKGQADKFAMKGQAGQTAVTTLRDLYSGRRTDGMRQMEVEMTDAELGLRNLLNAYNQFGYEAAASVARTESRGFV